MSSTLTDTAPAPGPVRRAERALADLCAELGILLAPVVVVTITSALGFGLPRFRHAGELAVLVLAAVALDRLLSRRSRADGHERTDPGDEADQAPATLAPGERAQA